jgi:hypothetical protein
MQINKKTFEKFIKDHSFYYLPSQSKLSYPKLERILKRMMNDKELPPIKIANGKIIEGHHRYLCAEYLKKEIAYVKGGVNHTPQIEYFWSEILIEDIDWDQEQDRKLYEKQYD